MGSGVVTPMLSLRRCKQPPLNHHHPPSSSSSTTFITLLCCHYSSLSCNFCLEGRVWRSRKRLRSRGLAVSLSAGRGDDASASANENRGGDDGDGKVQDMLVNMVRLQAGEVQVNKFIDDRAKLLTDIAEGAKTEYGRIAEDAKRSIDEAGSKVLESVDADVQALEEELASVRAEIEADEREFDEFESNVEKARNAGLFFKGLYQRANSWKNRPHQEQNDLQIGAKPLISFTKKSAGSKSRTAVYGFLIFLLTLTLVEVITSDDVSWHRVAVYLAILLFVVFQLIYEKSFGLSEKDRKE